MKDKFEKLNKYFKDIVSKDTFSMEAIFFIGLIIIIITNFILNMFMGLYFLGFILIAYSIFLFKFNSRGGEK